MCALYSSNNIEVTQEDFRQVMEENGKSGTPPFARKMSTGRTMARRIGNMLSSKKKDKGKGTTTRGQPRGGGDNATIYSAEGEKSVAVTVHSQATVKVSNGKGRESPQLSRARKMGWKTFKKLVGATDSTPQRAHARSADFTPDNGKIPHSEPGRRRVVSEDETKQQSATSGPSSAKKANHIDLAIRGRQDGVDVLSLVPLFRSPPSELHSLSTSPPPVVESKRIPTEDTVVSKGPELEHIVDPFDISFTGVPLSHTSAEQVTDMILSSAGKEQPELMLEGYIPGGGDRWSVLLPKEGTVKGLESHLQTKEFLHALQPADDDCEQDDDTADLTEDGSTNLPSRMLWDKMWGDENPPPVPAHMRSGEVGETEDEDVLQLAAACSVPIDLDEDTFIIDSPDHLRSVHELATVSIQQRKFDSALSVLTKLLKGLEAQGERKLEHLQGCTRHNIGMLLMCQGDFEGALESFHSAVDARTTCLPANHPDIAVSLMRLGEAQFALESFDDALKSFEQALGMSPSEDATRAKMLNNIGVAHFHRNDCAEALKSLTAALEIQRQWLDGPVRRSTIVYDASMTLGNMGRVFLSMGEFAISISVFEEACLLQTTTFRKDHDVLLASFGNMALTHAKNKEYAKSTSILRSILRSLEARFGSESAHTIETVGTLALSLVKDMDFEEGLQLLKRVEQWQDQHLPSTHSSNQPTRETTEAVERIMEGKASLWV